MRLKAPTRPTTMLEWFWAAGIIFAALIAGSVIIRNVGSTAYAVAIRPVADSLAVERAARIEGDRDMVRRVDVILAGQQGIKDEVHEVHTLLVSQHKNGR